MSKHKKLLTSVVALGTAAALTLGGTFAWQSISQGAVNEASDIVNPGGRLHNDQHWVNDLKNDTNIYVENFTDPETGNDIYARVRLSEYMEVVMNYGSDGVEAVETVAGKKLLDGVEVTDQATDNTTGYTYEYDIHYFGDDVENATDDFFKWTEGKADSETVYYMPTFNKNKDSLLADLNGEYVDTLGGISNRRSEQYTYTEITADSTAEGWEVWDGDSDTNDDVTRDQLNALIESGADADCYDDVKAHIALVDATGDNAHTAAAVGTTKDFISMADWQALVTANADTYVENGVLTEAGREAMYGYWVYDTDGWVYWSAPIKAGETTGLLLDGFELDHVMDDTWYYAINVEAQFVTPDDVGKEDGTGFYTIINAADGVSAIADGDETAAEPAAPITEDAENLLALLGVYIPADTENTITDWYSRVTLRNVTFDEYDLLCDATDEKNDLMHWQDMFSITDTLFNENASSRVFCGYSSARYSRFNTMANSYGNAGFRPAFEASTADCVGLKVGDVRVMGTLYLGEEAVKVPSNPTMTGDVTAYDEDGSGVTSKITLGAPLADEAYQMKAVYVGNGLFVCDRCMLNYISWNQFNAALTPDTPTDDTTDDNTDDTTITEVVTSPDTTGCLTVKYKRSTSSFYEPGSSSCEFKFRPIYKQAFVEDASRLSLAVTVDGASTTTISGDQFGTTTLEDQTWYTCIVSDAFKDKTGDVTITLAMTCQGDEGENEITTQNYTITFTPRS